MFVRRLGGTCAPVYRALQPVRCARASLSFFSQFKKKSMEEIEAEDLGRLEEIKPFAAALMDIALPDQHPLQEVSKNIRASLIELSMGESVKGKEMLALLEREIDQQFNHYDSMLLQVGDSSSASSNPSNSTDSGVSHQHLIESSMRLLFFRRYLRGLIKAGEAGTSDVAAGPYNALTLLPEIKEGADVVAPSSSSSLAATSPLPRSLLLSSRFLRLSDAFLLGSSAERLMEHMRLCSTVTPAATGGGGSLALMSPFQLQSCCYVLLEGEISTITAMWLRELSRRAGMPAVMVEEEDDSAGKGKGKDKKSVTAAPKKGIWGLQWLTHRPSAQEKVVAEHSKKIAAFRKTYLLDRLELNVKARCVFAWADPSYKGFTPVEETQTAALEDLLLCRQLYFPEALDIANAFVKDYVGTRRAHYHEMRENRTSIQRGTAFFIACCILDYVVCTV